MGEAWRFRNVKEEPAAGSAARGDGSHADKRGASSVVQRLPDRQTQAAERRRGLESLRRADPRKPIIRPACYSPFDGLAARVARSRDVASTR